MSRPEPSIESEQPRARERTKVGRQIVRVSGVLLVLASLAFVAERLARNLDSFSKQSASIHWALLPLFLLVFTSSQLLISLAFHRLLSWQGNVDFFATGAPMAVDHQVHSR